jgi:hypothetical protein
MNAMLEARMVAASTHFPEEAVHPAVAEPARMTLSSQGSRIAAIMFGHALKKRRLALK